MHPNNTPPHGSPAWWEAQYRQGRPPWDSGIAPPELRELVDTGQLQAPGVTLDLGCGTGTNVIYLAQLGFTAVGVDVVWLALLEARRKARAVGVSPLFCQGDVANLEFLDVQADFALDMGCLHSLTPVDRDSYVESLARRLRAGGLYLLYGFDALPEPGEGSPGFKSGEIAERFAPTFELLGRQPSLQGDRPVAWYLLRRSATER